MSREPSVEQIEAIALVNRVAHALVRWANDHPECDTQGIVSPEWAGLAEAAIAAMNAEPLTSTPEPSTTETGAEGPITLYRVDSTGESLAERQIPGFVYEYRAVHRRGLRSEPWTTDGELVRRYVAADDYYRLERRLVGPPERIEES